MPAKTHPDRNSPQSHLPLQRDYFALSVIGAPISRVLAAFDAVAATGVTSQRAEFVFPEQPYSPAPTQPPMLLWSPRCSPGLTCFMPSVQSGDYFVSTYARAELRLPVIDVRSSTQAVEWPINEFAAYQDGRRSRFVRVMRDGARWEFYEEGAPLPFEDLTAYGRKQVRDRFQRDTLLSYVESWGAPARNPEFWETGSPCYTLV